MSDFLTRLIQRTLGSPALAQPLVLSRFARHSPASPGLEATGNAPPAAPAGLKTPEPPPPALASRKRAPALLPDHEGADAWEETVNPPPARSAGNDRTMAPRLRGEEGVLLERPPTQMIAPSPPDEEDVAAPETLLVPLSAPTEDLVPFQIYSPQVRAVGNGTASPTSPKVEPDSPPTQGSGIWGLPKPGEPPWRSSRHPCSSRSAPSAFSEPPPVQVTIGRVEVKALLAAPPAPRPVPPPTPRMSLEEYLRQGKGGRR